MNKANINWDASAFFERLTGMNRFAREHAYQDHVGADSIRPQLTRHITFRADDIRPYTQNLEARKPYDDHLLPL